MVFHLPHLSQLSYISRPIVKVINSAIGNHVPTFTMLCILHAHIMCLFGLTEWVVYLISLYLHVHNFSVPKKCFSTLIVFILYRILEKHGEINKILEGNSLRDVVGFLSLVIIFCVPGKHLYRYMHVFLTRWCPCWFNIFQLLYSPDLYVPIGRWGVCLLDDWEFPSLGIANQT